SPIPITGHTPRKASASLDDRANTISGLLPKQPGPPGTVTPVKAGPAAAGGWVCLVGGRFGVCLYCSGIRRNSRPARACQGFPDGLSLQRWLPLSVVVWSSRLKLADTN